MPVHAVVPDATSSALEVALAGAIAARIKTNLAFRVDGKVTARPVEAAQHVAADTVLAALDPTEQKADVENAQAALNSAEALLPHLHVRTPEGAARHGVHDPRVLRHRRRCPEDQPVAGRGRQGRARQAKEQLSYTDLRAGRDGIIVSRSVEVGQVVQERPSAICRFRTFSASLGGNVGHAGVRRQGFI